jgi:hypothetical protein
VRPRVIETLDLTLLGLERAIIHGTAVDARGRSGFEARDLKSGSVELLRQVSRRRITSSAAGQLRGRPDVDPTAQECPSRDYHCASGEASPFECFDSGRALTVEQQPRNSSLNRLQLRLLFQQRSHCAAIQSTIALRARRPNCRTLTAVEHSELHAGQVRRSRHDPAKRIDLAHDRALRHATDRRITGHLADGLERARDQRNAGSSACRGYGGFGSSVATANYDDVEFLLYSRRRV